MFGEELNRLAQHAVDKISHDIRAKLADYCLRISTYRTRKILANSDPIRVLIDNSVLGHATTHETVGITQEINWPPGGNSSEVTVMRRSPIDIRRRYGTKVYDSVRYLPGISHLARCGLLQLFTSSELQSEQAYQPIGRFKGNKGWFDWWLFDGIEIPSIDGSMVSTVDLEYFRSNPTIDKIIYSTDIDPLNIYPNCRHQQIERLSRSNDTLYLDLSRILPPKSNLDAWHIRTAETYRLFAFVTMDFKLRSMIEKNKEREPIVSLRTRIMTPAEFGRHLGIHPVSPYISEHARDKKNKLNAGPKEY